MLSAFFVFLYKYFSKNRIVLYVFLTLMVIPLAYSAWHIQLDTDITKMIPDNPETKHFRKSLENLKSFDKIVLLVHSTKEENTESIHAIQDSLTQILSKDTIHIKSIDSQIDDSKISLTQDLVLRNLPLYFEAEDYTHLETIIQEKQTDSLIQRAYSQFLSPVSLVLKNWLLKDPMMLGGRALQNLQKLQADTSITVHNGYLMKNDLNTGIVLIKTVFSSNQTEKNKDLIEKIEKIKSEIETKHKEIRIFYLGAPAIASLNSKQIQQDIRLTLTIAILLIVGLLYIFYRNIRTAGLIFLPLSFGALFSLGIIALTRGQISIIALASGAVIIGIAMDYSFHVLGHFLHVKSKELLLADISGPLLIGSSSTVGAFLSLLFTHSDLLIDFGLFSALMLTGAALFSLIFLPHFLPETPPEAHPWTHTLSDFFQFNKISNPYIIYASLILTVIASFYAGYVQFEPDLMKINYIPDNIKQAEKIMVNEAKEQKNIFVVSKAKTIDEAIIGQEKIKYIIEKQLKPEEIIQSSGIHTILQSRVEQQKKIDHWNAFWQKQDTKAFISAIQKKSVALGMKPNTFSVFFNQITQPALLMSEEDTQLLTEHILKDFFTFENGNVELLQTMTLKRKSIIKDLPTDDHLYVIDRQAFYATFTTLVGDEFNQILFSCSIMVFFILWLSYGRLELTAIAFLPMIISWIWILAFMYLFDIQFNIVNIILSTFIFGLGDDYSIFFVEGLQSKYATNKDNLKSYKVSIMLSALTTVMGLGVMIFAQHPALKSIAFISVLGMVCVVVVSYIFIPFLFNLLITSRLKKGLQPITLSSLIRTLWIYFYFSLGCILLTILGVILFKIFRLQKNKSVFYFYHKLIQLALKSLIYSVFTTKKNIINPHKETFEKPAIVIANHQSFLDILITLMIHPKMVLVTNQWVWKSPLFGWLVRMAGFISTDNGLEEGEQKTKDLIADGYSIVVFPEGTRSADLEIKRFHKGAFFLAEQFQLDIIPIVIEGAGKGIRKGDMILNTSDLYISILERISPQDTQWGNSYSEKTKKITTYFRKEYDSLRYHLPNVVHYPTVLSAYIYKGPILEWYFRIKVKLEKYYQFFEHEIPKNASIINLGCGYGFLDYFLMLQSKERTIQAFDYDEDKIQIAQQVYLKNSNMQFSVADISELHYTSVDVILMLDVLHYLSADNQKKVVLYAFEQLKPGGKLIIRDGDVEDFQKHKKTALTEYFSIQLFGFNKAQQKVSFLNFKELEHWLQAKPQTNRIISDSKHTSNKIIIFEKYGIS